MKHRWSGGVLLAAALTLGACAPTDAGADDSTASPTSDAPTSAPDEGTPAPADYEQDEY